MKSNPYLEKGYFVIQFGKKCQLSSMDVYYFSHNRWFSIPVIDWYQQVQTIQR